MARVRGIHDRVTGTLPDGTPYAATDPHLLAWVHVTEATSFLAAWQRYGRAALSDAGQDRYLADMARVAIALGADPVPRSRIEAAALIAGFRPELRADHRSREVARLVLHGNKASPIVGPARSLIMQAAIDLLPDWARAMHGLNGAASAPLVRAGTMGIARTLRWAFG